MMMAARTRELYRADCRDEVTCSINAENQQEPKGFGCRETGPLGPSRKENRV